MNNTVREPARDLPVSASADVVVAGGGIAGVAAALAAARAGASTLLLENTCTLGGLATAGNVTIYLPIDDGRGRVVLGGVARELFDLSVADIRHPAPVAGFRPPPPVWLDPASTPEARAAGPRLETGFNPDGYVLALEELLLREGVRILYDTRVCAALRDGDRVTHLAVENKSGRTAVACGAVVDATGDADVCFLAGEPTVSIDANVAGGWFYTVQDGRRQAVAPHLVARVRQGRGQGQRRRGPVLPRRRRRAGHGAGPRDARSDPPRSGEPPRRASRRGLPAVQDPDDPVFPDDAPPRRLVRVARRGHAPLV